MKWGFTDQEVQAMWLRLRPELAVVTRNNRFLTLPMMVNDFDGPLLGADAYTDFDGGKRCLEWPKAIHMNREFAQYGYEDEVRDVMLHESAHAIVGNAHDHDKVWANAAYWLGAYPHDCLVPRNVKMMPSSWLPPYLGGPPEGYLDSPESAPSLGPVPN